MSPEQDAVLLEVTRGELVESRHRGSLVLLDGDGAVEVSVGDVRGPVYARSSLKPLQAVAMLAAGFTGPSEQIAMAAASHNAEPAHRTVVREILAAADLDVFNLQCPPALPRNEADLIEWTGDGGGPARVCHNCSGKHAAKVSTCVAAGWDVESYLDPQHPLQREIVRQIERLCAAPIGATSVDGCGAPAHAVPLTGLARAFAALATAAPGTHEATVTGAMRAHPWLVGGTGRAVSELLAEVDGLVCKDGAEAVWAAALPDGRAFACKVADGSPRTLPPMLASALRFWGFDGPAVRRWSRVDMLGGGHPVGAVRWSDELRELLGL